MAGATNRQLKTAGIPKAAMAQIRVHAGGRLSLKSALDVAERHGIAIPDKAHAFMAARDLKDRKVALQAASARRGANVTRAIGDASKVALAARKEAARQKSVSQPVDAAKGRGKSGAMGNTKSNLSAKMTATLAEVNAGKGHAANIGTLTALRDRGLVTFSVKTERRRHGRGIDNVTVIAALTDAGRAAMKTPTEAERYARAVDIAAERAAREGKKNAAEGRRVAAWRKKSTGKRIL